MKRKLYLLLAPCFAYSVMSFANELLVALPLSHTAQSITENSNVEKSNILKSNPASRLVQIRGGSGEIVNSKIIHKIANTKRYIVELEEESVLTYKSRISKHTRSTQYKSSRTQRQKMHELTRQSQQIHTHHQNLKQQQQRMVSQLSNMKKGVKVLAQHQNIGNMLVIESNPKDIAHIKQLNHVKSITEEKMYHKSLADSVPLINATNVWETLDTDGFNLQGEGVNGAITVAIIDTGVDYTHPALGGCFGSNCRVVDGYDFVNNDNDPMDDEGHGTHVAGIVGANSDTLKGVAPKVNLYAYKVLNDQGIGSNIDIIAAIEHAVDPDGDPTTDDAVDIINMSLGGEGSATDLLSQAVDNAVDAGVIVVVAAGNNGAYGDINNESPASAVKAITVASSTKGDELSDFSSKAILADEFPIKPEITAPGSDIISTDIGGGTVSLSGTSMATPHIAGAIALLKQVYPELTAQQAKEFLSAGSIDLGLDPLSQGAGRVDIEKSLQATFVLAQSFLNFGSINTNINNQQSSQLLTIKNLSATTQTYTLTLPSNLPEQAQFSFNNLAAFTNTEVTIEANSSVSVNVNLVINDITTFPFSESAAGIFYGNIAVTATGTSEQTLRSTIVLENSHTLMLSTNASNGVDMYIHSNDFSFSLWQTVFPDNNKTVKVPNKALNFNVSYHYLENNIDEINDNLVSDLPENASITGYETYALDIVEDTDLFLDINNLTRVIGVQSLVDDSGAPVDITTISTENTTIDIDTEYGGSTHNIRGGGNEYAIFGNLTTETVIQYQAHNKLTHSSVNNANEQHWYSLWYEANADELVSINFALDLSLDPFFDVNLSNALFNGFESKLGIFNGLNGVVFENVPEKITMHYLAGNSIELGSDFAFTEIALLTDRVEDDHFDLLASTNLVTFYSLDNSLDNSLEHSLAKVNKYGNVLSIIDEQTLTLEANSTFWSAPLSINTEDLSITGHKIQGIFETDIFSGVNYISDVIANRFGYGLNSQYQWLCNGEEIVNSTVDLNVETSAIIPLENIVCDDLQIAFLFDSFLQGNKHRSSAIYDAVALENYGALHSISLFENNVLVSDQILNKINNKMVIKTQTDAYQSLTVQFKLDDDEWISVVVNNDASDEYTIEFPMVSGAHIADIKLTFITASNQQVEHTLNGFFIMGADAGTGNDVDDDGILNSEDPDNDNDGVADTLDLFPYNSAESSDFDADGLGDNSDNDDDNDGVADENDDLPFDNTETVDTDNDGTGNNADNDDDGDGVNDTIDVFPLDSTRSSQPVVNTPSNTTNTSDSSSGGGGGSFSFILIMLLLTRAVKQRRVKQRVVVYK